MKRSSEVVREEPGARPVNGRGAEVVVAEGLERVYGEGSATVRALDGVSLGFERGRVTAIMGASGSGKSTLMHCLAGLDRPTAGRVLVDGTDLADLGDKDLTGLRREKMGFVFQAFNLLPVLSAEENVVLPLSLAGEEPDRAWLEELLDTMNLGDRRTHRPAELSGGQQQRVALARALVHRPAVVFADEPTGNLDSRSSEEILALLRRSADDLGQTVVMVTHDAAAAAVADRLVVLRDGRVVHDGEAGSAEQILDVMKRV